MGLSRLKLGSPPRSSLWKHTYDSITFNLDTLDQQHKFRHRPQNLPHPRSSKKPSSRTGRFFSAKTTATAKLGEGEAPLSCSMPNSSLTKVQLQTPLEFKKMATKAPPYLSTRSIRKIVAFWKTLTDSPPTSITTWETEPPNITRKDFSRANHWCGFLVVLTLSAAHPKMPYLSI